MAHASSTFTDALGGTIAIVGRGRLGHALARALTAAGLDVRGPLPRGERGEGDAVVLLCVPDREISNAAALIAPGRLVGHCSGAQTLKPLRPHEAFSVHPLMTVVEGLPAQFAGAAAAVAGSTPRALDTARAIAAALGMRAVEVPEAHRALYHAAASMASNYFVTLEAAAERAAADVGVTHEMLVPLVRAAFENWAERGADSLTGPIRRGDERTVAWQRSAIAAHAPELLPLWDALAERTAALARDLKREP